MRVRLRIILVATCCAVFLLCESAANAQERIQTSIAVIDHKANAIRSFDKQAIADEIDSVIRAFPLSKTYFGTAGERHDSLVAAELLYHQGKHAGVTEAAVARAINRSALMFNAPIWAQTSTSQVRRFRASMIAYMPSFIGKQPVSRKASETSAKLPSLMSPGEAVFVFAALTYQKMNNPEWQLSPKEERQQWSAKHRKGYEPDLYDQRRSEELRDAIRDSLHKLSLRDIEGQGESVLHDLGIGGGHQ